MTKLRNAILLVNGFPQAVPKVRQRIQRRRVPRLQSPRRCIQGGRSRREAGRSSSRQGKFASCLENGVDGDDAVYRRILSHQQEREEGILSLRNYLVPLSGLLAYHVLRHRGNEGDGDPVVLGAGRGLCNQRKSLVVARGELGGEDYQCRIDSRAGYDADKRNCPRRSAGDSGSSGN